MMNKCQCNLISIIIPCYNTGRIIKKTLECIQKQTITNYELLIIDDGSTDKTSKYVKEFIEANQMMKIKYFFKENGGVSSARNYGIEKAAGEYIVFIDSDDIIEKELLESLQSKIIKTNYDIVISNAAVYKRGKKEILPMITENGKINTQMLMISILNSSVAYKKYGFEYNFGRSVCGKLYKKEIIIKNKIKFDERMFLFEDGFFNLNYLEHCKSITFLDVPLYTYMIEQGNSTKFRENIIEENHYKIKKLIEFLKNQDDDAKVSMNIYFVDLFSSFIKRYVNNKKSCTTYFQKRKIIKLELKNIYSEFFTNNIFKYLNVKKKIVFIITKLRLYYLIMFVIKKKADKQ